MVRFHEIQVLLIGNETGDWMLEIIENIPTCNPGLPDCLIASRRNESRIMACGVCILTVFAQNW